MSEHADLVLLNGKIITMGKDLASYSAVAVKGDRIIAVGTDSDLKELVGEGSIVVDLKGRTVLPGFQDCHCHFMQYGLSLSHVDFRGVDDMDSFLDRVEAAVDEVGPGGWILGHGWDQDKMKWDGKWGRSCRWPNRFDLDSVAPNNPVFFTRICCHVAVVNSLALEFANITRDVPDPPGGQIDRDSMSQEPTGILKDSAMNLVRERIPSPDKVLLKKACKLAVQEALEMGVTSIEEAGVGWKDVDVYRELYEEGFLNVRVNLLMNSDCLDRLLEMGVQSPYSMEPDWIRIAGVKIFADGSLGGRTALLEDPYSDALETRGLQQCTQVELNELVLKANEAGLSVAVHAIGDRANKMVLDAFEYCRSVLGAERYGRLRNRIEHCSVLDEGIIARYEQLGVVASIQLSFATSDMDWILQRLGPERIKYAYPWRTLLDEKIRCVDGTDCPVEELDPILNISNASTRTRNGFSLREPYLSQRLTVKEALQLVTSESVYGTFEEDRKGTLESGKLADLVVLSSNPLEISDGEIRTIRVLMTVVGGKVAFKSIHF
ncbi:MAG: amidohydrolase [Nitrososphaeria archaeon]